MPRSAPRKLHKYSDEFKLTAVQLSQLPGIQVKSVAASVRREIRLGVGVPATPNTINGAEAIDLDGLLERLTPEQRALLAERLKVEEPAPAGPSAGPKANAPESLRDPARTSADVQRLLQERATGLEPATSSLGRRTKRTTDSVRRQFSTANVLLTALRANRLAVEIGACGPLRPPLR
jgi:hypothetical protein